MKPALLSLSKWGEWLNSECSLKVNDCSNCKTLLVWYLTRFFWYFLCNFVFDQNQSWNWYVLVFNYKLNIHIPNNTKLNNNSNNNNNNNKINYIKKIDMRSQNFNTYWQNSVLALFWKNASPRASISFQTLGPVYLILNFRIDETKKVYLVAKRVL